MTTASEILPSPGLLLLVIVVVLSWFSDFSELIVSSVSFVTCTSSRLCSIDLAMIGKRFPQTLGTKSISVFAGGAVLCWGTSKALSPFGFLSVQSLRVFEG